MPGVEKVYLKTMALGPSTPVPLAYNTEKILYFNKEFHKNTNSFSSTLLCKELN